jgi:hypothetical protein
LKEIVIPKIVLFATVILVVLVAIGNRWIPGLLADSQLDLVEQQVAVPSPQDLSSGDDTDAQSAAFAGAHAFYNIDYQTGIQVWLDRLCNLSTKTGCIVYQNVIGPNLWLEYDRVKTVTSASVTVEEKIQEQIAATRGNIPMQVWRLQIELSAPLPQQKDPQLKFTALALVIKEQGMWKFERFLSEEEMQTFSKEGDLP